MIEVILQLQEDYSTHPFAEEDLEKLKEYKPNQLLRCKIWGARKPRSLQQLKLLHALLRKTVESTKHPNWNSLSKAKFSLKVALHYVDEGVTAVDKHGTVHFSYRSFGYEDLPHMEACRLFERAWPILAKVIGVSEDELLENVEI